MFTGIKNHYLRFALNLLVLFLILFVIDRVAGNITKRIYFSQVAGANYRTTYAMDSTTAEILVFGSSRASHHYVPEVFEDSLKMSFYNAGSDGNSILYTFAIFKTIMKRHTPKIIIIDLRAAELNYNSESYDRLSCLQPYYYTHPEIQSIVNLRGQYEKYKMLSASYPFNSSFTAIIVGNMEFNKKRKSDQKGYIPLFNSIEDTSFRISEDTLINYDNNNINAIKTICQICNEKKIILYLIQSPLFLKVRSATSNIMISKIAEDYHAYLLNYLNDSLFINNPSYFKDKSHLNDEGAKVFSSEIVEKIKIDQNLFYLPITGTTTNK